MVQDKKTRIYQKVICDIAISQRSTKDMMVSVFCEVELKERRIWIKLRKEEYIIKIFQHRYFTKVHQRHDDFSNTFEKTTPTLLFRNLHVRQLNFYNRHLKQMCGLPLLCLCCILIIIIVNVQWTFLDNKFNKKYYTCHLYIDFMYPSSYVKT